MKIALITGINGQDGSYLAELLLNKGYKVCGIIKRNSVAENQTHRLDKIFDDIHLSYGDMTDMPSLIKSIRKYEPDEIYNLAAQSHVKISFDEPVYTTMVNAIGVLNLLESCILLNPNIKIYQASSSEMFGNNIDEDGFQRETTPMCPVSPYGCSKLYSYNLCRHYRDAYNMFISNGILFNHESNRRPPNFITGKIAKGAALIKHGSIDKLHIGNLEASRDWGHSKDYVKAMWKIMQHHKADDFVCATGISHTVRELCEFVFGYLNLNYENHIVIDEKFLRQEELHFLKGDASKIKKELGWKEDYSFESMMQEMADFWMKKVIDK